MPTKLNKEKEIHIYSSCFFHFVKVETSWAVSPLKVTVFSPFSSQSSASVCKTLIKGKTFFTRWFVTQNNLERHYQKLSEKKKKKLGRWLNKPISSITGYLRVTSTNPIEGRRALPPAVPVGKSNSVRTQSNDEQKHVNHPESPSLFFFNETNAPVLM